MLGMGLGCDEAGRWIADREHEILNECCHVWPRSRPSLLTHITHINHQQIAAGHPGPLGTVATKFALHEIILNANYVDTEK